MNAETATQARAYAEFLSTMGNSELVSEHERLAAQTARLSFHHPDSEGSRQTLELIQAELIKRLTAAN